MARKRSTRRRTTRRRAPRRRGFALGGNFLPAGAIPAAIATTTGFMGVPMAMQFVPIPALQSGWGGIAAKVGLSALAFMVARRMIGQKHAGAFAIGGLASAAVDAFAQMRGGGGVSGLGADGRYYVASAPSYSFAPSYAARTSYSALPVMQHR